MIIAQTNRLILRTVADNDLPLLHKKIFSYTNVMQLAFSGKIFDIDGTKSFIDEYFAAENSQVGLGPIVLKNTNELIGFAGILPFRDSYELGFVLSKNHWGNGYAAEIGLAQIDLIRSLKKKNAFALVSPDNEASKSVLGKLSMDYMETIDIQNRGKRDIYAISI